VAVFDVRKLEGYVVRCHPATILLHDTQRHSGLGTTIGALQQARSRDKMPIMQRGDDTGSCTTHIDAHPLLACSRVNVCSLESPLRIKMTNFIPSHNGTSRSSDVLCIPAVWPARSRLLPASLPQSGPPAV
jgi:hypothetical protein